MNGRGAGLEELSTSLLGHGEPTGREGGGCCGV